jgi:large subunit ribosomal protein L2
MVLNTRVSQSSNLVSKLTLSKLNASGRNSFGRIVVFNRGGGHKRRYRYVDFKRFMFAIPAKVVCFEYDPNRGAYLALILYSNGFLSYIIAPARLLIGDFIICDYNASLCVGNRIFLQNVPVGSLVHGLELGVNKGGTMVRSAGTCALIIKKDTVNNKVLVRLPSKEERLFDGFSFATIGSVSNSSHYTNLIGKAGRSRWLNRRPNVRGVAMNPVDHPHGGRTGGSRPSVSA